MALIIAFRNISKLANISDYEYTVLINETILEQGLVRHHERSDGWPALVQAFIDQRPRFSTVLCSSETIAKP